MKQITIVVCLVILSLPTLSQTKNHKLILERFVEAHNNASEIALQNFIKDTYHPELYSRIDIDKHIEFYDHIIREFGPLQKEIYEIIESNQTKLIVHLIKREENLMNKNIDPADVLVVEIDLHPKDPKYLSRGLGLGALICEIKRE